MCYPKPGPRCSRHAEERLNKALARLHTVTEDYAEARAGVKELHSDEVGYVFTEKDLPTRTVQRVKTAQTRVVSSYRMLDGTPEGKKHLESLFADAQTRLSDILAELKHYPEEDAHEGNEEWVKLNVEKISARSVLSRLRDRHTQAIAYREFCLQEYRYEQTRNRLFGDLKKHAERGDVQKYARSADLMRELNEKRVGTQIAENFYQQLPVFSQAKSSFPMSVGDEERSTHYVELSQGGKARIENRSFIMETGDTVTVHHTSEIHIKNPKGPEGTRKGYGSSLKGRPATFSVQGNSYPTAEEAQRDLAENRLKNSYYLTNRAVFGLLAQIDGQRMKGLHSLMMENYEQVKAHRESLVNTEALNS